MQGGARAEKQRIRQEVRMIAEQLTPDYRREASREITRRVLALPFWKEAGTVMAYWSMPSEPDTRELMETALKLKSGESVDPVIHPTETFFSDEMDPSQIAPRGY